MRARRRSAVAGPVLLLWSLLLAAPGTAWPQNAAFSWRDIDCPASRIVAWRGLTCRESGVTTSHGRIAAFRQWAAFGPGPAGYYVHMFLAEAVNGASLEGDETMSDFVKWMVGNGTSISRLSDVQRGGDADYVTFLDDRMTRQCVGFRRLGDFRRHGYERLTGGLLCAPPGAALTTDDVELFIENVRLRPAGTSAASR